jgi:hypothetical protein
VGGFPLGRTADPNEPDFHELPSPYAGARTRVLDPDAPKTLDQRHTGAVRNRVAGERTKAVPPSVRKAHQLAAELEVKLDMLTSRVEQWEQRHEDVQIPSSPVGTRGEHDEC